MVEIAKKNRFFDGQKIGFLIILYFMGILKRFRIYRFPNCDEFIHKKITFSSLLLCFLPQNQSNYYAS